MRKVLFILLVLMAFSLGPNGQTILSAPKHSIEYVEHDKSRSLSDNEMLRKKVMLYMRYNMLLVKVLSVDCRFTANTS